MLFNLEGNFPCLSYREVIDQIIKVYGCSTTNFRDREDTAERKVTKCTEASSIGCPFKKESNTAAPVTL